MKTNIKSAYIHIPFCKKICNYCSFCKLFYEKKWVKKYLSKLEEEIKSRYKNDNLNTLYIGGGTPSCLSVDELEYLLKITNYFNLEKKYEFTFECNIEDINEKLLLLLKKSRVNRLSIGIQTFNQKYLDLINRKVINIDTKIKLAKKHFSNINIDLMYGFSNQTIDELKDDIKKFIKLDVTHISTYCLILEDNTVLKTKNYQELDDFIQRKMYDYIRRTLIKSGYIHYEFSNFCKRGYESKHNLTYWNNNHYYGFGLNASGFEYNKRYTNTKSLNNYLNNKFVYEENKLILHEDMSNEMILGLRKIKGVSKKKFFKKYKKKIDSVFDTSKLKENKSYYYISKKHLFISNSILIDFL